MRSLWRHLTYANATATLCLFLLLGGGAYAATRLPNGSVGPQQLRKGAVTTAKIKAGAITGGKIRLATLGQVPNAQRANLAVDTEALGGQPAGAYVRGHGSVLTARRELQIGDVVPLLELPGIGVLRAGCEMGAKKARVVFAVDNQTAGTVDQTLEFPGGIDAGTIAAGKSLSTTGSEGFAASRIKVATHTTPVTVATLDVSMAAEAPSPCGVFVQALVSSP